MNRRLFLQHAFSVSAVAMLSVNTTTLWAADMSDTQIDLTPLQKDVEQWRDVLSPESYGVLFKENTERAGSSPLNDEKRKGLFVCAACHLPLFDSAHKYESGTGWPSFTQPIAAERIGTKKDYALVWPRIEYHCIRCGGHQGHVFNDGPAPRGERWCNNGLALRFIPEGQALPELRS